MDCCNNKKSGFGRGLIYGLFPHIGCVGFIIFSILGVTTATRFFRPLLLNSYFLYILIFLSIVFATISALLYLKKTESLSIAGIFKKKKYISALYGTTIVVNLVFFLFIFPAVANINFNSEVADLSAEISRNTLQVDIPCEGHSFLINFELREVDGVEKVEFVSPNYFEVFYDDNNVNIEEIISLDVFNEYKATLQE